MRRAISLSGIVLLVIAFVGIFSFGMLLSPPPSYVMVAAVDIPAGSVLAFLPDTAFRQVAISTDAAVIRTMLAGPDLRQAQASGGVLLKTLHPGEPILWTSILAEGNPAASIRTALGMSDPNLVSVVIPATMVPTGLEVGDCVDLVLALSMLDTPESMPYSAAPSYGLPSYYPGSEVEPSTLLIPTESPTPTSTPTPSFSLPLAKTVVHCARIVNVIRTQSMQSSASLQSASAGSGEVTAIEVMIPRTAEELLSMAVASGQLAVYQVSPSAADLEMGPSIGASAQDIIDLFYADRDRIRKEGTPTPIPTMTLMATPTLGQ